MWYPPGLKPGSSAAAGSIWEHCWHVLTAGPVRALFAPGSFIRSYALLTVPALGVAAVAGVALLARSPLGEGLKKRWRGLLGWTMGLLSLALADDALRRHLLPGRLFLGCCRGALAVLMGFWGAVLIEGREAGDVGDSFGKLSFGCVAATLCVGGGTLIHKAMALQVSRAVDAGAAATGTGLTRTGASLTAVERVAFSFIGTAMLLSSVWAMGAAMEQESACDTAGSLLRALELRWLARGMLGVCKWLGRQTALRSAVDVFARADKAATAAAGALLRGVWQTLLRTRDWVLQPSSGKWALRALVARAVSTTMTGVHRTLVAGARFTYTRVLRPPAATAARIARDYAAPVLWPAGSAAAVYWFTKRALETLCAGGAVQPLMVLPYGVASYVSIVSLALIAGKAMRRTPGLFRAGTALESAAASVYMHLDLGLGTLVIKVLKALRQFYDHVVVAACTGGHWVLLALSGPYAAVTCAGVAALKWAKCGAERTLGPVFKALRNGFAAIWKRPERALLATGGLLAIVYGAHKDGLMDDLMRQLGSQATEAAQGLSGFLAALVSPVWALASRLGLKAASLMGSTAGAGASALASWGGRAAGDVSSIFASASFAGVFAGLHILHAVALRSWGVTQLEAQGLVGSAALTPIVSFVARSTCKVALAPAYLAALASLLAGQAGSGLAAKLAAAGTPVLWVAYLAGFWTELEHRVRVWRQAASTAEEDTTAAAALAALRSQVPPPRIYETDICTVCFQPLDMRGLVRVRGGVSTLPAEAGAPAPAQGQEAAADAEVEAEAEQEAVAALRCGHAFHQDCALMWLARETRCPLCREPAVGLSRHANALF
ncbi:hypothetical protein HYH03_004792 [Edaphochlamys debaryana]|uniref:RING-type domain-containing protein n=1 Tax=Edaphochlamys debaryana TaxID=47281 RepID=A0A836C2Y2_9CHLO|nr:hypothetical protein HYH03_004792 [Edaphochlamys debaryana]|eukprot:KAG2497203.1 hypothetical protein HYH03_004792 [Edaphochlamys debaryana]